MSRLEGSHELVQLFLLKCGWGSCFHLVVGERNCMIMRSGAVLITEIKCIEGIKLSKRDMNEINQ